MAVSIMYTSDPKAFGCAAMPTTYRRWHERKGGHWVNLDLPAGWNSTTGSEHDLDRLGFSLGAAGQSPIDVGAEGVSKADVETARHLGRGVTAWAMRLASSRGVMP
jgi:hypothetical protein